MPDKVLTPLKDEHKDGWTIVRNDNDSAVLTRDGITYYLVTKDGCSCGRSHCVHQKLIYPTPDPPPRPPANRNPNVDIRHDRTADEIEEESGPSIFETKNTMLLGLLVVLAGVSIVFRALGWFFTTIGDALDFRIKSDGLDTEID